MLLLNHSDWKCIACEQCKDICPGKCLDVRESFDLSRLLEGKSEVKAEVDSLSCDQCSAYFSPTLLNQDLVKQLTEKSLAPEFLTLCPKCRTNKHVERIKILQGVSGRGR